MQSQFAVSANSARINLIDAARGIALIAMTIFHLSWDLALFRFIDPDVMVSAGMIWFARTIAGSFLFLVGFSLYLAHGSKIRWSNFLNRLVWIAGAAAIITIVTYFATPDAYIFFGILHSIALGSVFGLAVLKLDWRITGFLALIFLLGKHWLSTSFFDAPIWLWTGLSEIVPRSNDFVPIFPFFGMVLAGIAAARLASEKGWTTDLAAISCDNRLCQFLRYIGRNSLVYYLLHQPALILLVYIFALATGHI
ncbi:MAG: DUF1624 domain-containing protein [Rhizobiaceae bacterium]